MVNKMNKNLKRKIRDFINLNIRLATALFSTVIIISSAILALLRRMQDNSDMYLDFKK